MKYSVLFPVVLSLLQGCNNPSGDKQEVFKENFQEIDSADWIVESETPISWNELQGKDYMDIDAPEGVTIWYSKKLKRDVVIEIEVTVVDEGGPNDRISDLNCFWMATDPENPNDFFKRSEWRQGIFWRYYSLNLYYVGLGGHDNTKTRFRKYHGSADPMPEVVQEYTNPEALIFPNQRCIIRIVCNGKNTQYFYNGRKLFDLNEEKPYKEGYFGFRTVNNHMKVHSFSVYGLDDLQK